MKWFLVILLTHSPQVTVGPFDSERECMDSWRYTHKYQYSQSEVKQIGCIRDRS